MWIGIAIISGLASLGGYALFQDSSPDVVASVLATTIGFAVAFTIHVLD
jgi:zinc transporter, ZIP family